MMENILLSNLEFERDIVIYNSDDLNIKTESQSSLPVQVLYIIRFYIYIFTDLFPGFRSYFFDNVQIRLQSVWIQDKQEVEPR